MGPSSVGHCDGLPAEVLFDARNALFGPIPVARLRGFAWRVPSETSRAPRARRK
jgi:hypothetical protein